MKKLSILVCIFSLLLLSCNTKNAEVNKDLPDGIYALIETSKGDIIARLEYEKTPFTVANFITLAEGKNTYVADKYKGIHFYDGLTFHRVEMNPPVIQGGCPLGNGQGGPGYKFKDEFHPDLKHSKMGILSMANSGVSTNGSQFFITLDEIDYLDNKHTVFGEVIEGLDVLPSIVVDDEINSITIIRKGTAAKKFDAVKTFKEYFERELVLQKEIDAKSSIIKSEKVAQFKDVMKTGSKTKSGVIYKILKSGSGNKPLAGTEVFVNYSGFLEDGTLFDSSSAEMAKAFGKFDANRNETSGYNPLPVIYGDKMGMIPGFIEGLDNMKYGDKAIIFIPSYLGYGKSGAGEIPPNANLYFELEILEKK